jgi:ABC-type phosphate/phosphonate transport system substrate-binding protein
MTLWLGAVAYDPKVVTIWEGMKAYFKDEAKLDLEVVLFLSYEAQVAAVLGEPGAPKIDVAWNTNLAYLQSVRWSAGKCEPIAMRDTDLAWYTKIVAPKGGAIKKLEDLRGKTLALGSRDSGHAAILPVHFLAQAGLLEGKDYQTKRFDLDVGKHGDTGTSEVDVLRAVMSGAVDAGAVGSPFWDGVQEKKIVPVGSVVDIWTSPVYSHCMFTARAGLDRDTRERFTKALYAMSWDNPVHRPVLEAEGLKKWVPAQLGGYASLDAAGEAQGFFKR